MPKHRNLFTYKTPQLIHFNTATYSLTKHRNLFTLKTPQLIHSPKPTETRSYTNTCQILGNHPGGSLNFFQVGVCGRDFRSVGLANRYLPLKEGACELKMSKFGACELKISKFGGL